MRLALALVVTGVAAPLASAVGSPSPSGCAVAWNRWAPPRLHAMVATSHSRAAFIRPRAVVGNDTWSKAHGGDTSTSSLGCSIEFVLPGARGMLVTWGAWRSGTIRVWRGPVPGRAVPVPRNARVHGDGTVGFTG